ncbi:enoyl-[acyl-carrier-protein] reductase [NADH], chloroplastic-like protein [Tanacetum coccineum]|uniref:Enoyl-[acyl-carrier-protein] reductase [NADH], chloroplastic-like protein n=1 Tax=Tanacetum coccineum TaxID=301880 RepID=A0ABQ5D1J8_9ASTR
MATTATTIKIVTARPSTFFSCQVSNSSITVFSNNVGGASCAKRKSLCHNSSTKLLSQNVRFSPSRFAKMTTKAVLDSSDTKVLPAGLPVDLRGKRAFVAGIADDNGYGWAIAKSLAAAGAQILVGTWVPFEAFNIFETSLRRGKFDESRVLPNGSLMNFAKVYPLDAVYATPEDVPEDVKSNKRYMGSSKWTIMEVAESVQEDFGTIDILVHSLAYGPEVTKPLLETSSYGYLAAMSASSYSFISLLQYFVPIMNPGGATISLSTIAAERVFPGYGGGMSSAKAALESDTKVLAFEAGRKHGVRVNTISAGALNSRAAKATGVIDRMIGYSLQNAPLQKELLADDVGNAAAFLVSPLASAITGTVLYVDNGLNVMGIGVDSPYYKDYDVFGFTYLDKAMSEGHHVHSLNTHVTPLLCISISNFKFTSLRIRKMTTKAMPDSTTTKVLAGLPIDLRGGASVSLTAFASARILSGRKCTAAERTVGRPVNLPLELYVE